MGALQRNGRGRRYIRETRPSEINYFSDSALPGPGTVYDDITDTLPCNQSATTNKRAIGEDGFDEQMLEAAMVLSKTRFNYGFGVSV